MRFITTTLTITAALAVPALAFAQDHAAELKSAEEAIAAGQMEKAEKAARAVLTALEGQEPDAVMHQAWWIVCRTAIPRALEPKKPQDWDWDALWECEGFLTDLTADGGPGAQNADQLYQLAFVRSQMAPNNGSYVHILSEGALKALDGCLAVDPKHVEAGYLKGVVLAAHHNARDLATAAQVLEADLKQFNGREKTAVKLCQIYAELGALDKLTAAARAGLGNTPNSSKLRLWMGKSFQMQGNHGAAVEHFKQAAQIDPKNHEAVQAWAMTAGPARISPDTLLKELEELSQSHPDAWAPDEVRASVLREIKRGDDALVVLNGLLDRFKESDRRGRWALMQATIYHQRGEAAEDKLIEAVFKVLAIEPTSSEAVALLTTNDPKKPEPFLDKYRRTGEFKKGAAFAERLGEAVGENPENDEWTRYKGNCWAVASECWANLGENEKAEAAIKKAIDVYPRQANFHNSYGLLLRYMGRVDEAVTQWKQAIDKQIDLTWAWENLGSTYISQGKIEEARKALTQGLEWAKQAESQSEQGQPLLQAKFESWKMRRLLIEAWRIENAKK
ncbi:MAG: tetratricopeptide repeat protein [Planctomycetota bacterium]|jgi:tetratricopeptide (TPR) repeat protein